MLQPLNKIETWLRETYVQLSSGRELDRISNHYGFRRPQYINDESWRAAMKSSIFSARGTPGPIFRFLEEAFGEWTREISTYSAYATAVNILEFDGASCNHEGRFARINGKLYRSSRLRGDAHPGQLVFIPVTTSMFNAAVFTPGSTYEVSFLPFDIEEYDCEYRILIDSGVLTYPKFYFPTEVGPRAEGEPQSGHLMDYFSQVTGERYGNQIEGPHPIYLSAEEFGELFFDALDMMLAAGIHERVVVTQWCADEASMYGSIFTKKVYGSVSATQPPLIVPTRS